MDAQWRRLEPLLPPERPWTGRPNEDHRRILNGMLWVHRTGAPWRDLPRHYGPVGTVSSRFHRWRAAGIWDQVLMALQAEADARGEVDWDLHVERRRSPDFVDATVIRAHQHAAGARRDGVVENGENVEALGRSQGGFSTKLHLRAEGGGKPVVAVLTGGERHEQIALDALLDNGAIRRPGRGRPRLRPRRVAGDKGYSSPKAPAPAAHPAGDPQQKQPAPPAALRSRCLLPAQPHRAPDQPPQAVPPHRDPLREARHELPGHDHTWH